MKEESSPRANDILRRVRGSADPQPRDEARVLARVEQRLGMISQLEAFREPGPRRANGGHGHASSAGLRAPLQQLLGALPRVGLWAAFGVSMAAIGYGVGTRGTESQRTEVAALARSSEAVVGSTKAGAPAPLAARSLEAGAQSPRAAAASAPLESPPPSVVATPGIPAPVATAPAAAAAPALAAPALPERVARVPAASLPRRPAPPRAAASSALADEATASATMVPSKTAPRGAAVTPEPEAIGLREALQLLERAQAAVRLGTAGDALDLLDQLERRNPGPLLEQERLVTRALAQCALGEVARARATRRQLERLEPESIYRGQLDASCAKRE